MQRDKTSRQLPTLAFEVEPSNRRYRLRLARYRYQVAALAEHVRSSEALIIDAGCGKGRLPLYWRRWSPPERKPVLVGIEISPRRLDLARLRGYDLLIHADLTARWPIADGAADAVICDQVLEHLRDEEVAALLAEANRALKIGGIALFGSPIFWKLALLLLPALLGLRSRWRSLRGRRQASHLQHLSHSELRTRVERAGFAVESSRGFRVGSLPRNWLEDFRWYYRLQQWLGKRFPGLCIEVTLVCRKVTSLARQVASREH
jgi:SAM-dependent methyltransferase